MVGVTYLLNFSWFELEKKIFKSEKENPPTIHVQ